MSNMNNDKTETKAKTRTTTRRTVLKGIGYMVVSTTVYSVVSLSTFGCSDSRSPFEPTENGGYGYY